MHSQRRFNLHVHSRDQNERGKEERFCFSPRFHSKKIRNSPYSRTQWATELRLNFGRKSVCSRQLPHPHPSVFLLALCFLSHPSVTTASIMWEIVSGAGCWNRTMCARLSMSATCPRRRTKNVPAEARVKAFFRYTRKCIFPRTFRIVDRRMPREIGRRVTLKYHRAVATSFGKSLKWLTFGNP